MGAPGLYRDCERIRFRLSRALTARALAEPAYGPRVFTAAIGSRPSRRRPDSAQAVVALWRIGLRPEARDWHRDRRGCV